MPAPLSQDLRNRIVEAYKAGEGSFEVLAERFKAGVASVNRLVQLERRTGSVEPMPHGGGNVSLIPDERLGELKKLVGAHADATLAELVEHVAEEMDIQVTTSSLGRALQRAKITRKKRP